MAAVAVGASWPPGRPGSPSARSPRAPTRSAPPRPLHFDAGARADRRTRERTNPLSVDPLFQQAAIERADGDTAGARGALQEAVRKQPANPATWLALAEFELSEGRKPQALSAVGSALYLDPRSPEAITHLPAGQPASDARRRRARGRGCRPAAPARRTRRADGKPGVGEHRAAGCAR